MVYLARSVCYAVHAWAFISQERRAVVSRAPTRDDASLPAGPCSRPGFEAWLGVELPTSLDDRATPDSTPSNSANLFRDVRRRQGSSISGWVVEIDALEVQSNVLSQYEALWCNMRIAQADRFDAASQWRSSTMTLKTKKGFRKVIATTLTFPRVPDTR